jgi:hypothetical protein
MMGRWGMSEKVGPVALLPADGAGPLLPGVGETNPRTPSRVDLLFAANTRGHYPTTMETAHSDGPVEPLHTAG